MANTRSNTNKKTYVKMQCAECNRVNYFLHKSRMLKAANTPGEEKLELKKFCPQSRTHTVHKEAKK